MELRLPSSSLVQVGGKQKRFFWRLGWKANDRDGMQGGMDPGDETQAPIRRVQADDARADGVEAHSPFQEWASERSIMDVGGGEQVEDRQAGATTEQGVHAIAA